MAPHQLSSDEKLDEALDETFPASDPPANTVETGIQLEMRSAPAPGFIVRDNPDASRFEVVADGKVAFLKYERRPDEIVLVHTEVPRSLRGRGIGGQLARFGVAFVRAERLRLAVECPFVRLYLRTH